MGYRLAVGRQESVLDREAQDQVLGQGEPGNDQPGPAALPVVNHVGTMVAL